MLLVEERLFDKRVNTCGPLEDRGLDTQVYDSPSNRYLICVQSFKPASVGFLWQTGWPFRFPT